MEILREWRELSEGGGGPVVAHGNDIVIGFEPGRPDGPLGCAERSSEADLA